jgi:hypothetical protein
MFGDSSRCAVLSVLSVTASAALISIAGCSSGSASGNGNSNMPVAAAPSFSLAGGSYNGPQTLTITDSTPNAVIYYTTNGSTPTASSAQYAGALSIASTETIEAVAVASGYSESAVASATYSITAVTSAAGDWTWMSGSSSANALGIYGTSGVAAASNVPAAREGAMSWTDGSGNLWLFGGQNSSNLPFNDLWRYNPTSGLWTWVSGSNAPGPSGVYGTQGIAAAGNVPAPRYGGVAWTDSSGNLWMFGGASNTPNGFYNDLWMFNPQTSFWTWVSGSSTADYSGSYGVQGVPSASNVPGARNDPVNWIDGSGNLWLFGGGGYGSNGFGGLNDLWKFNTSTRQWTWVSGSSTVNQTGVYGTQGTASAGNVPGARGWSSSWIDSSNNLWLFGGWASYGTDPFLNDLWEFNIASSQWTWVSGSSAGNAVGVYGTQGVPAASNVPGSRMQAATWVDATGNLWLFGGDVYVPPTPTNSESALPNDLWKFSPTNGEWTWMSGTSAFRGVPVYGTQGSPAAANIPGGRQLAVPWVDSSGDLWLFGGSGITGASTGGELNDLWRFQP